MKCWEKRGRVEKRGERTRGRGRKRRGPWRGGKRVKMGGEERGKGDKRTGVRRARHFRGRTKQEQRVEERQRAGGGKAAGEVKKTDFQGKSGEKQKEKETKEQRRAGAFTMNQRNQSGGEAKQSGEDPHSLGMLCCMWLQSLYHIWHQEPHIPLRVPERHLSPQLTPHHSSLCLVNKGKKPRYIFE